jgi:hypothetical protein
MNWGSRIAAIVNIVALCVPQSTWAAPPSPTPSQTPNMQHFQGEELTQCNNICDRIVGPQGRVLDVDDNGAWDQSDDQWCATHGISRGGLEPNTRLSAVSNAQNCPYYLEKGESCEGIQDKILRCEMLGSDIYARCLAYKQQAQSNEGQAVMIALDTAAAAVCTVACVAGATGSIGSWGLVCNVSGQVNGLAQMIAATQLEQNEVADAASSISGFGGMGLGMVGETALGVRHSRVQENASEKGNLYEQRRGNMERGATREEALTSDQESRLEEIEGQDGDDGIETGVSCGMAALFAATAITRGVNVGLVEESRKNICKDISARVAVSQDQALRRVGQGGGGSGGSFGFGGGGGLGSRSGNGNPFDAPVTVTSIEDALNNPRSSAATDGQLFNKTGLGNRIKDRVPAMAPGILAAASRGDHAGMFAAALPSQAAALAGPLSSVGSKLASKLGGSNGGMLAGAGNYSGGGGRGPASGGGFNPFGALGAKSGGAKGGDGVGQAMDFGAVAESTDIWHSNTDQNIFQIVSGRIDRVQRKQAFR